MLLDCWQALRRRTYLQEKGGLFALLCLPSKFLDDLLVVLMGVESIVDVRCDESSLLAKGENVSLWGNQMIGRDGLVIVDVLASDNGTVDMHIIFYNLR